MVIYKKVIALAFDPPLVIHENIRGKEKQIFLGNKNKNTKLFKIKNIK
jgi:hypothetical protein